MPKAKKDGVDEEDNVPGKYNAEWSESDAWILTTMTFFCLKTSIKLNV